ncbi:MAG TPA: cobalamin-binding protein [Planctomycetaceae bacterium]|jgi:iron complex transport system substrate-binding protein|nr:cobalamin-binding protein [Planctomycetaceae bacterium]
MPEPRIVSLIASATEIVAALGFGPNLVGRSHECDFPSDVLALPACSEPKIDIHGTSREIDDRVKSLAGTAVSIYRVFPDVLRQLKPTHIITQTQCEVCAVSLKDVEQAMAGMIDIDHPPKIVALNPMALADVWTDIRAVAESLGASERGERLIASLQHELDAIRTLASGACRPAGSSPLGASSVEDTGGQAASATQRQAGQRAGSSTTVQSRPSIACLEWIDPLMSCGNWVPELVELAGGRNLLGEAGKHSPWLEWDGLAACDADVIAIMPCGFDIPRTRAELPPLTEHPRWQTLRAVRDGRVYLTDGNQFFNRPGPRLVESARILAEILHPDLFGNSLEGTGWVHLDRQSISTPTIAAHL